MEVDQVIHFFSLPAWLFFMVDGFFGIYLCFGFTEIFFFESSCFFSCFADGFFLISAGAMQFFFVIFAKVFESIE